MPNPDPAARAAERISAELFVRNSGSNADDRWQLHVASIIREEYAPLHARLAAAEKVVEAARRCQSDHYCDELGFAMVVYDEARKAP